MIPPLIEIGDKRASAGRGSFKSSVANQTKTFDTGGGGGDGAE